MSTNDKQQQEQRPTLDVIFRVYIDEGRRSDEVVAVFPSELGSVTNPGTFTTYVHRGHRWCCAW